ncbi:hypothetical protein EJK54_1102 [Moraxella catarrhalis]|uniref:Uncharacterized protein n=1 Tax=Moraxella catarrhalis TaxID=480 RepID=A0ABY0BN00_MORCA|nr:hypothetical protein EJK54_1102 [Moraxella catarrhalis]
MTASKTALIIITPKSYLSKLNSVLYPKKFIKFFKNIMINQ